MVHALSDAFAGYEQFFCCAIGAVSSMTILDEDAEVLAGVGHRSSMSSPGPDRLETGF